MIENVEIDNKLIRFTFELIHHHHQLKLIRKSGKQHVTSFYRRFKTQSQLLVQTKHDTWKNLKTEGKRTKMTKAEKDAFKAQGSGMIYGRDRALHEKALKKLKRPHIVPRLGPHQW